jgi:glycosyltransferase involved in cell wall biosynthesis
VITTSTWTRDQLLTRYQLPADALHVAEPGVDPAAPAVSTADGTRLLCVAAVAPHKGHDLLLAALTTLAGLSWRCAWVGPVERDPAYVVQLRQDLEAAKLAGRVRLTGPLTAAALDRQYRSADVLVHASVGESYGMVVTEALAHGLPVIAAAAGGLPAALGHAPDGVRPGILVPPGDALALAVALRGWLAHPDLRRRLREAAAARRATLPGWSATTGRIARVLTTAAA